jgi:hypothetical protein
MQKSASPEVIMTGRFSHNLCNRLAKFNGGLGAWILVVALSGSSYCADGTIDTNALYEAISKDVSKKLESSNPGDFKQFGWDGSIRPRGFPLKEAVRVVSDLQRMEIEATGIELDYRSFSDSNKSILEFCKRMKEVRATPFGTGGLLPIVITSFKWSDQLQEQFLGDCASNAAGNIPQAMSGTTFLEIPIGIRGALV